MKYRYVHYGDGGRYYIQKRVFWFFWISDGCSTSTEKNARIVVDTANGNWEKKNELPLA